MRRKASSAALFGMLLLAALPLRAGDAPVQIVMLPIRVHSAAPDAAYVSRGLADMIASRLEQTGRVQVRRVDDAAAATTSVGVALERGQKRGGDYVVFGAFTQFGDGASLDVHCLPLDVASEAEALAARRIFIQSGAIGALIPKIDDIVDRVAIYVKAAPGPERAPASGSEADAATLAELRRRLEALESRVFVDDAKAAAAAAEPPPES